MTDLSYLPAVVLGLSLKLDIPVFWTHIRTVGYCQGNRAGKGQARRAVRYFWTQKYLLPFIRQSTEDTDTEREMNGYCSKTTTKLISIAALLILLVPDD